MSKILKATFITSLLALSANAFASDSYALVVYSPSVNYMNTMVQRKNQEQCLETKAEFEKEFANEATDSSGKTRFFFKCINVKNGAI